jgi:aryl-alcohol dehydrogenase-like predicted oxidoreductase
VIYAKIDGLDTEVSRLSFGGWQLGGHGWGKVSENEMIKAVHKAIDCDINFFDTAPIYGLGHSEELLGNILNKTREKFIIATKVGLHWNTNPSFEKIINCSRKSILKELDESLVRLKTNYIDLYQIHWPDCTTDFAETFTTMEELRDSGKISCIGCCNFSLELLKEAMTYCKIDTIQVPYNLLDRNIENELLPFCNNNNIKVLAYGPLAKGFLTGKYNSLSKFGLDDNRWDDKYFDVNNAEYNSKVLEKVRFVSRKLGKSCSQIALRWVLDNPSITSAIFGAKNVHQTEDNIETCQFELPKEYADYLNRKLVS